jgi:hypothetical protein
MGRRAWSTRLTVEECKFISVSRLTPATKIGMRLGRLIYRPPGDPSNNVIEYTSTKCHFGGERFWFICPYCSRRVSKLYLPPSGDYYACRKCHNLTYESCKEHDQRIDAIIKNPEAAAKRMKGGRILKEAFLILKARDAAHRKRERRMRRYLNQ